MLNIRQTVLVFALLGLPGGAAIASSNEVEKPQERSIPTIYAEVNQPLPNDGGEPAVETEGEVNESGDDTVAPDTGESEDDFNLGEIPEIQSVELTLDLAKRALDTWLVVRDKYKDADIEAYDDLQEFVDKNEQGSAFEADIKAAGFATASEWNVSITSLSFAYSATIDDPSAEITAQIEEIKVDDTIAQDMKDRMIASLGAMIPSENNRKIVAELLADPAYKEKLEQLETGVEEGE